MSQLAALFGSAGVALAKPYIDDLFSAFTYTGNGATQTINNGIDLAGKGGLVWIKSRSLGQSNNLYDTVRGVNKYLVTEGTNTEASATTLTAFNANGFSINDFSSFINDNGVSYVSWAFRKAQKFFDVVSWSGDGTSNRVIPHNLGVSPGMIIVKAINNSEDWLVWHRSLAGGWGYLHLNTTSTVLDAGITRFSVSNSSFTTAAPGLGNANGVNYVAYLFAHDSTADGLIQCGTYTGDNSSPPTIALGWEPQFLMVKNISATTHWMMFDSARGMPSGGVDSATAPSGSFAESSFANDYITPLANGFKVGGVSEVNGNSHQMIYVAIRRSNKPPASGTQVYNAISRTGTGASASVTGVGFAPDLVLPGALSADGNEREAYDRLRGMNKAVRTASNVAENTWTDALMSFDMDGVTLGADAGKHGVNYTGASYCHHFFKRAVGFFDEVCYAGTGAAHTEAHGLGVAPELMLVKVRSSNNSWAVYHKDLGVAKFLVLEQTTAQQTDGSGAFWNNAAPGAATFSVGTSGFVNGNNWNYVAYLFATLPGISKVGSYTGNGTSQTINCGFAAGARFVLIKRVDSTGDWLVWNTVRGIVAGNDPHISLNMTSAEVTTNDSIDPDSSGFIVNQVAATNINVNSAQYIYLAIA